MAFLDCPAYMDRSGGVRCGLPAEVECRYTVRSSDGPLESAKIRCPRGHWFNGPTEFLTWDKRQGAAAPLPRALGGRARLTGNRAAAGDGEIEPLVPDSGQ